MRVQTRTHNPVGASPTGANKAQGPVAREAPRRESTMVKPSDNILARGMRNAPGCNVRERTRNLVTLISGGRDGDLPTKAARGSGNEPRNTTSHRRGNSGDMERRVVRKLERSQGARRRNLDEEVLPITVSGKWRERHREVGSGHTTYDPRAT